MIFLCNMFPYFSIIWILLTILESFIHFHRIEVEHRRPNYLLSFLRRGIFALVVALMLDPQQDTGEAYIIFIYEVSVFWVIFSPLLNTLRKKDFWYLGDNSGWIDRFFLRNPKLYKTIYFMIMFIAVVSGIQLYQINRV